MTLLHNKYDRQLESFFSVCAQTCMHTIKDRLHLFVASCTTMLGRVARNSSQSNHYITAHIAFLYRMFSNTTLTSTREREEDSILHFLPWPAAHDTFLIQQDLFTQLTPLPSQEKCFLVCPTAQPWMLKTDRCSVFVGVLAEPSWAHMKS